jgi:hypothetical protein
MLRCFALIAALLCASFAHAATIIQRVETQPPGWTLHNGLMTSSSIAIDYANQRYWIKGAGYTGPVVFSSITRASAKNDLIPSSPTGYAYHTYGSGVQAISPNVGNLIEESRVNQLFNSTSPATQTTPSLATGTYTLTAFAGSGSLTMSSGTATGCGSSVASMGTPATVTITVAGTCTVTLSGSLACEQLELGSFGTSCIVTAGATATRAADNISLSNLIVSDLNGSQGFLSVAFIQFGNSTNNTIIRGSSKTGIINKTSGPNFEVSRNNFSNTVGTVNLISFNTRGTTSGSWGGAGLAITLNNGTVATAAETDGANGTYPLGSSGGSSAFNDGPIINMTVGMVQPNNNALQNISP